MWSTGVEERRKGRKDFVLPTRGYVFVDSVLFCSQEYPASDRGTTSPLCFELHLPHLNLPGLALVCCLIETEALTANL